MPPPLTSRKLRAFVRWMEANEIRYSDGLQFKVGDGIVSGKLGVKALYDFQEGDLIATIPKLACLTVRTTDAAAMLEDAKLAGGLGLAVALMYEKGRGERSPWFEYLQLLPVREALPIVWEAHHLHSLRGTELYQVVQDDRKLVKEDWEECILPLSDSHPQDFPMQSFTLEQYLSAKTLVASRAFEVDEYHGYGMVPLADLFNHKTGAEDVHFTSTLTDVDSDIEDDFSSTGGPKENKQADKGGSLALSGTARRTKNESFGQYFSDESYNSRETSNGTADILEMILVRNVASGTEIFNTYGKLGNAALLHRYGFTEVENCYDIVNIEYALVMEYCLALFSKRHVRKRLRLWRSSGCMACTSQSSEYFEISACGVPQLELLFLLFLLHLPDDAFDDLVLDIDKLEGSGQFKEQADSWTDKITTAVKLKPFCSGTRKQPRGLREVNNSVDLVDLFLTRMVCEDMLWLCRRRDEAYGTDPLDKDHLLAKKLIPSEQPELFHAMSLRISERCILRKVENLLSDKMTRFERFTGL